MADGDSRPSVAIQSQLGFGEFRLDVDRARLFRGDEPVNVTPKALDILVTLVQQRHRVVSKDELLQAVWPDTIVEEGNLAQQVFTLRRVLGDDRHRPRFIATLSRRGYRFIGDVVELDNGPAPASTVSTLTLAGGATCVIGTTAAIVREHELVQRPELRAHDADRPFRADDRRDAQDRVRGRLSPGGAGRLVGFAVAGLAGLGAGLAIHHPSPAAWAPTVRFEVSLPPDISLDSDNAVAGISPDGTQVAFAGVVGGRRRALFARRLDTGELRELPGTGDAAAPFWSRDGRSIAFFAEGKLRVVSAAGGPPSDVCDAPDDRGGSWGLDDTIVFASGSRSVLYRVSARGGTARAITALDPDRRDISHRFPHFLPDGRRFLFVVWSGDVERQGIFVGELDDPRVRRVLPDASPVAWSAGHLVFVRREALVALAVDESTLRPTGEPVTVASPVARQPSDASSFAASPRGLVFTPSRFELRLVWLDRSGREVGEAGPPAQYGDPAIAPGSERLAFSKRDRANGVENFDLWTTGPAGDAGARLTFDPSVDVEPVWSPDGREILFRSNRSGFSDLYRKRVDGTTLEEMVYASPWRKDPSDWTADGRSIVFTQEGSGGDSDIWMLAFGSTQPTPVVSASGIQRNGRVSPDGRFIAYESLESGSPSLYVQSIAGERPRWLVGPGEQPAWRSDGRELFLLRDGELFAVPVTPSGNGFSWGTPAKLFELPGGATLRNAYAVSRDGHRFVAIASRRPDPPGPLTVILNWRPEDLP